MEEEQRKEGRRGGDPSHYLALIVVVESGLTPPGGAVGGQLHYTCNKHQSKEQPTRLLTHQPESYTIIGTGYWSGKGGRMREMLHAVQQKIINAEIHAINHTVPHIPPYCLLEKH